MTDQAAAPAALLRAALSADDSSDRLQAALTAGTRPDEAYLEPLLDRCAVEPDFYVRDMLTWALTRLPRESVLPRVVDETRSGAPQARSQALHTLSKLGDERAWPAITAMHLHDPDVEVARAAWRTAAGLAPEAERGALARELAVELGRGDIDAMRSLSRAFAMLGEAAAVPVLEAAAIEREDGGVAARHARATLRLIEDPDAAFALDPA